MKDSNKGTKEPSVEEEIKKGIDWSKEDMYEGIGRPELKPKNEPYQNRLTWKIYIAIDAAFAHDAIRDLEPEEVETVIQKVLDSHPAQQQARDEVIEILDKYSLDDGTIFVTYEKIIEEIDSLKAQRGKG